MEFDFKAMQAKMSQELAQSNSRSENSDGSGLPLVYIGQNGKVVTKLFYNAKMKGLQRKIVRHPADKEGKTKIPCLKQMYGNVECPICEAIKNIKQAKGDNCGVDKYAYKARGICYGQLIDFSSNYCSEENAPKKGDIVMLMYPRTIYEKINQLMVDSGEDVGKLIASNTGFATILSRTQVGKKYEYAVSIDALKGEIKSFDTVDEYESTLENLPDLSEAFAPSEVNEELCSKARLTAETIMQEFIGSSIVNPGMGATESTPVPPVEFDVSDDLPFVVDNQTEAVNKTVSTTPDTDESANKPCFGQHKDNDATCMNCPVECDCIVSEISS